MKKVFGSVFENGINLTEDANYKNGTSVSKSQLQGYNKLALEFASVDWLVTVYFTRSHITMYLYSDMAFLVLAPFGIHHE